MNIYKSEFNFNIKMPTISQWQAFIQRILQTADDNLNQYLKMDKDKEPSELQGFSYPAGFWSGVCTGTGMDSHTCQL
jgi:hypothetical protein